MWQHSIRNHIKVILKKKYKKISGFVGGIVVGYLSQYHISVSISAGLTTIILTAITDLGAFNIFLLAVLLAGIIQLVLDL